QRFSIRKYHIGAASVLLGMTLAFGTGVVVNADGETNTAGTTSENVQPASDGTNSTTQQQSDNQGVNSSGVQTDNTTNSTANDQPAGDTGSASGQPVGTSRSADTGTQGDGSTNQPVAEPIMIIPSSASEPAPPGYVTVTFNKTPWDNGVTLGNQRGNSVRIFVKNTVTWGTLLND
ncbi:YSIRK-type signal peptide-containing protein, partial [Streptococcus suis]|uniref:YSIRK-type signal peptide-containing protein n=1 Tax=Streptococcus suis TaxID=1307 RepID=UPI002EB1668A|nr:YSIRK-type signal peptide-containing protein [Streptococcus suis]